MEEHIEQKLAASPNRGAVIDGLSKARSITFALVNMDGRLVIYNPQFAKAVGWNVATDDLSKAGTALGKKLASASRTAAWQGISVKTTWTEGGWSEYEILPAGDEGAIILGHLSVPRSCLVADSDRAMLYNALFAEHPLPMMMIEPVSKVVIDANGAASRLLGVRKDILISMVADQAGLHFGGELTSVPAGTGKKAEIFYRPRHPGEGEKKLTVMLDHINLGGLDQILLTVLDIEEIPKA